MSQHFFVIGDVMLDIDYQGKHRGNEEDAELCLTSDRRKIYPGGAAWVAWLLAGAGHEVDLFGVVGPDTEAEDLVMSLPKVNRHLRPLLTSTIVKRRVYTERGVYRFDTENPKTVSWAVTEAAKMLNYPHIHGSRPDCVLFVDYNKGVFWEHNTELRLIMEWLPELGIPTVAAIKPTEYLSLWKDVDLAICNRKEARELSTEDWNKIWGDHFKRVIITAGARGVELHGGEADPYIPIPDFIVDNVQEVGAGDAFLAALLPHWLPEGDLREAVEYAILRATKYVSMPREDLCSRYFV